MKLGVMMLDTGFRRYPGDVGHPATWPEGTLFARVAGATVEEIVDADGARHLNGFVSAGEALGAAGATLLTTTCGFLVRHQAELARRLPLPVVTSSLLQLPLVEAAHGGRPVGVLTFSADRLLPADFAAAGARTTPLVEGLDPDGAFARHIRGGPECSLEGMRADVLDAAGRLAARDPALAAVVLECANMPPFAGDVAARLGVPVYDHLSLVALFLGGFCRAPGPALPGPGANAGRAAAAIQGLGAERPGVPADA